MPHTKGISLADLLSVAYPEYLPNSQPLVTVSSLATAPSSPCLLAFFCQMACNVCVGLWDFRDAQLAQLASFPPLVRSRLDPWGERHSRLSRPRPDAAASCGRSWPRRGGRAAAEVRRLRGGGGQRRSQTPELPQPWNCVGEESGRLLLAFNICPSGSFSCLCMTWCFWYRHQWQLWFDELLVLLSCVFFDESAKAGLSVRSL